MSLLALPDDDERGNAPPPFPDVATLPPGDLWLLR